MPGTPCFKSVTIDPEFNKLLCSPNLVGKNELVEVYDLDKDTPPQVVGWQLRKVADPNQFTVHQSFDGHNAIGHTHRLGSKCIVRVLLRNMSGIRRRRFANDEKVIVSTEKDEGFKDKKVVKAKTGSVRKKTIARLKRNR